MPPKAGKIARIPEEKRERIRTKYHMHQRSVVDIAKEEGISRQSVEKICLERDPRDDQSVKVEDLVKLQRRAYNLAGALLDRVGQGEDKDIRSVSIGFGVMTDKIMDIAKFLEKKEPGDPAEGVDITSLAKAIEKDMKGLAGMTDRMDAAEKRKVEREIEKAKVISGGREAQA